MVKLFCYLSLIILCISCKTNIYNGSTQIAKIENGLYCGRQQGLLGSFDYFIVVGNDIARSENIYERSANIVIEKAYADTMLKENDSLFVGEKYLLIIETGKLFFTSKNGVFNKKFRIELSKCNEDIRRKWDKRHNQLQLFQISDKYKLVRNSITDPVKKDSFIRAFEILQSKIVLDQESFLKELLDFKKTYLLER